MTNIFDMIKKSIYVRAKEYLVTTITTVAGFVLGHLIFIAVMTFDTSPDQTSFELGTMMAIFFSYFSSYFAGATCYSSHFNLAVSMGKRRVDVVTSHIVISLTKGIIATSLIYIFHIFESYVCRTAYSQYPLEFDFNIVLTLGNYFLFIGAFAAIETFLGAMNTRFGKKVFGVLWLISMFVIFIPTFIEDALESASNGITAKIGQFFIDLFESINLNVLMAGGIALIMLLLLLPYALLKKCKVSL